jgi:hypothetical protein
MNDDVPARDAEGRTSFYAEKTAQSLYAQLGLDTRHWTLQRQISCRVWPGPELALRSSCPSHSHDIIPSLSLTPLGPEPEEGPEYLDSSLPPGPGGFV